MASNGKPSATAYDAAIAVATDAEKERLRALRLRFNMPPDSPEWQFYAVLAPLVANDTLGPKEREELFAALGRLEQRADDAAKQPAVPADLSASMAKLAEQLRYAAAQKTDPFANASRYFFVFWAGAGACEAMFFAANYRWLPPALDNLGTFVLGLSATALVLLWLWIAPMFSRNRRF